MTVTSVYRTLEHNGWTVVALASEADSLAHAMTTGEGCTAWEGTGGRGTVARVALASGGAVVRRYRRGGLVRHLVRDAFLFVNRPLREFKVHRYCHEAGLPVPEPLGVGWRRSGPLVRGAIATREVQAQPLPAALEGHAEPSRLLQTVGGAIRRLHDAGVLHPDLQVHNLLAGERGVWVIDLDGARQVHAAGRIARARNLLRLRRSMEKNSLPGHAFADVRTGYGPLRIPGWLDQLYRIRGRHSDLIAGRTAP
jgi:3-deoxy-D-manno-octulosonic acid kinase